MTSTNKDFPPLPPPEKALANTRRAMQHSKATGVFSIDTQKPWSLSNLVNYKSFTKHFIWRKQLGVGGDGTVSEYFYHTNWKQVIAVKVPKVGSNGSRMRMLFEIKMLKALGQHDNIHGMLAYCDNFEPASPAIYFQVCDLGDAHDYSEKWFDQQRRMKGKSARLPEVTVLKLMRDVASALDFLHNGHDGISYVHNDLKPENILVVTPPGYKGKGLPAEPIFKITDLARSTSYPTPSNDKPGKYSGTPEFAPPLVERVGVPKPSVDMWCLGATVQCIALNALPIQSKDAFVRARTQLGKTFPNTKDDWKLEHWRDRRPVVFRPLNTTREHLQMLFDLPDCWSSHTPYSAALNNWYRMLFDTDPVARIASAHFTKYVIPSLEKQMLIAKKLELTDSTFEQLRLLQEQMQVQQDSQVALRMHNVD